jgi:hypothetical protein
VKSPYLSANADCNTVLKANKFKLIKRDTRTVEIFHKASVKWELNIVHAVMKGASVVEVAVKWNPTTEE